jgi:phosphate transport system protein
MPSRTQFEQELDQLKLELIKMGDQVVSNIKAGLSSFLTLDIALAEKTIANDQQVNEAEHQIQRDCMRVILREQPVAKDLRLIAAILKMITDLERIGDHAADISKMTIKMEKTKRPYPIKQFQRMTEASLSMIENALDAFVQRNIITAEEVINADDEVDELFNETEKTVAEALRKNEIDPDYALYAMMVAKYLERISDHAVNIGEWVIFSITGEHKHNLIF